MYLLTQEKQHNPMGGSKLASRSILSNKILHLVDRVKWSSKSDGCNIIDDQLAATGTAQRCNGISDIMGVVPSHY